MKKTISLAALGAACALVPLAAFPQSTGGVAQAAPELTSEKEAAARLAAQGWLGLLDRKDWGRAWESTASVFRSKVALGSWMDAIPKVRDQLGNFVDRKPVETAFKTALQGLPAGEYVTVVFQSKFDKREVAEVVTTMRDTDGRWRVTGYSAQ
jgi:hypothetical protein